MTIQFRCPKCGQSLKTAESLAGSKVRCARCGAAVPVPEPAEPPRPATPDAVLPTPSPQPQPEAQVAAVPHAEGVEEVEPIDEPVERQPDLKEALAWEKVKTALLLNVFADVVYILGVVAVGAWALEAISSPAPRGSSTAGERLAFLFGGGASLVSLILSVVGYSFALGARGKSGERGLAVASLFSGLVVLLLPVFLDSFTLTAKWALLALVVAETLRLTLFTFFVWAAARSLRNSRQASAALVLGIALPTLSVIFAVVGWYATRRRVGPIMITVRQFFPLVGVIVFCGLLLWHAIVLSGGQRAVRRHLRELGA